MNVLAHNLIAMNSRRMYGENWRNQSKSMEKLSSGYRINRAADDAAGLSISEKMRRQIRGLSQARDNVQDGISMVQIADGALEEVHDMLQRGSELMIKAANGTLSDSDRESINMEIQQLKKAIDGVAETTRFNETRLFPSTGESPIMANAVVSNDYRLNFNENGVCKVTQTSGQQGAGSLSAVNTGNLLAEKIATEYVPNAVNQIFGKFDSLKKVIDSEYTGADADKLKMDLKITYIDGPSDTLAFVEGYFYTGSQKLASLSMSVDNMDFSEEDVKNDSSNLGRLESTIGHEMMHAVMDAALPERMYRQGGVEDFPKWFVEGTAQLTGGGFTTGWNEYLQDAVKTGKSDDQIAQLMNSHKVEGDNYGYGHGYLVAAYLGKLASGSSGTDASGIASGINKIFERLLAQPTRSFEDVVNDVLASAGAGKTLQAVKNDIDNATQDGVDFVKELVGAVNGGAGSVIATGGLSSTAKNVLGDAPGTAKISIDDVFVLSLGGFGTSIQAGADSDFTNKIPVRLFRMTSEDLGISSIGSSDGSSGRDASNGITSQTERSLTQDEATKSIDLFKKAINLVSGVRSYYGAVQNRMEHTIANLENVIENTTGAESRIRDTDMASEMVKTSIGSILLQAGQAMMAQSNHANDWILGIIQ